MVLNGVMVSGQVDGLIECVRGLDTLASARGLRPYLHARGVSCAVAD